MLEYGWLLVWLCPQDAFYTVMDCNGQVGKLELNSTSHKDGLSDLGAKMADGASHPRQRYFRDS